jgi:type I restriction enzyme S subunit
MTQIELTPTTSLTGKWKSYPAYKDSGMEWLGTVPKHWMIKRLGHVSKVIDPQPDHRAPALSQGEGFPYIGIRDVNPDGTINVDTARKIEEEAVLKQETSFRIDAGDIIFCKVGTLGYPRHIKPTGRIALSATLVLIKCNQLVTTKYLRYVLDGRGTYTQIDLLSTGSTRAALGIEQIRKFRLCVPLLSEQYAIATFLDRETTRINALIAKKEQLIELLQEKRAALISHAVTKGLDPTVPMKDSGIEWLGEIPIHWEVKRLKFCLDSIEQGWSPTCENRPAEIDEWGVLKVGCVNGIEFHPNENKALPAETQPISELEIKQGDVLVSRANTRELLGSASVVKQIRPHLLLCDKLYRLKILPNTANSIYLVLAMGSSIIRFQLERDATGASNSMQNIL